MTMAVRLKLLPYSIFMSITATFLIKCMTCSCEMKYFLNKYFFLNKNVYGL